MTDDAQARNAKFAELHAEVEEATSSYLDAKERTCEARTAETTALNRLNAAQNALLKAVDELRKNAPPGSDAHSTVPRARSQPSVE